MKSAVTSLDPTRVKIEIEVGFDEMSSHIDKAYQSISKSVNIPGFRKGKIPQTLIDQRFGRAVVLEEAVNSAIPVFYAQAARENEVRVVGRPDVDLTELNDGQYIKFTVEVDVRPEVALPDFSKIEISVDDVVVNDADVEEQVNGLRGRFGTLTDLDRAVASGDFVSIDLIARVDEEEIEGGTAKGISYEVGTNRMIDGLDDALVGMSVGETKKFATTLLGDHDGKNSEVEVTVHSVKERILPELNDEFAQMASEFDSVAELREDMKIRLTKLKAMEQGAQARDRLIAQLLETVDLPVPEQSVAAEIHDHLERENRLEDESHRAEVEEEVRTSMKSSFLLDAIASAEKVEVTDNEISEYLLRTSMRYGMSPDEFTKQVVEAGNLNMIFVEVARAKALATVLERVKVKDASGRPVDLAALRPQTQTPAE